MLRRERVLKGLHCGWGRWIRLLLLQVMSWLVLLLSVGHGGEEACSGVPATAATAAIVWRGIVRRSCSSSRRG